MITFLSKNKEAIFKAAMLKRTIQKLLIIIQRIMISVLLFIIYYLVFGLTVLIAFLFNRKVLIEKDNLQHTSWREATGYEADMFNSRMQS